MDLSRVLKKTGTQWLQDKAPKLAAALAFYTAFSVAPILVIAVAIAGLAFGTDQARQSITSQISGLVGSQAGEGIEALLKNAWHPRTGILATVLGVVALLFGASGVFGELKDSLNIIWKVRKKPGIGIWRTALDRFLSLGMVLGIGFILLVTLVVSAALEALGHMLLGSESLTVVMKILDQGISLGVITLVFGAMFKVLPDARTRWSNVWVGALLTAVLFTGGKYLIGLYLGKSAIGSRYGAAGSFAILLLWIYYSSQIFFLGAQFTKVFADTHGPPTEPDSDAMFVPPGRTPA